MSTSTATVKPIRRKHVARLTPAALEFLDLMVSGWPVSAIARHFGWRPIAVLRAKTNFGHVWRIGPPVVTGPAPEGLPEDCEEDLKLT